VYTLVIRPHCLRVSLAAAFATSRPLNEKEQSVCAGDCYRQTLLNSKHIFPCVTVASPALIRLALQLYTTFLSFVLDLVTELLGRATDNDNFESSTYRRTTRRGNLRAINYFLKHHVFFDLLPLPITEGSTADHV
jgi:hypothetical protein